MTQAEWAVMLAQLAEMERRSQPYRLTIQCGSADTYSQHALLWATRLRVGLIDERTRRHVAVRVEDITYLHVSRE